MRTIFLSLILFPYLLIALLLYKFLLVNKQTVIRRLYFAVTDLVNGTNLVTTMLPEDLTLTPATTENLTLTTTAGPVAQALVSTLLPEKVFR